MSPLQGETAVTTHHVDERVVVAPPFVLPLCWGLLAENTYMYVCMYVCTYVCMYECLYVNICIHIFTYAYMCIYVYTHVCIYICIQCLGVCVYIYIYVCVHAPVYIYSERYICR